MKTPEEFQKELDERNYKKNPPKKKHTRCALCGLVGEHCWHGKTRASKSHKGHDTNGMYLCYKCHIPKVHSLPPDKFKEATGRDLSDFLDYREWKF